jgi:hypothetical protein
MFFLSCGRIVPDEIMIRTPEEKFYFFQSLTDQLDHFPLHVCKYRVLPALTSSLSLGATSGETSMGVAGPIVLVPLLKLGKLGNALFGWSHVQHVQHTYTLTHSHTYTHLHTLTHLHTQHTYTTHTRIVGRRH